MTNEEAKSELMQIYMSLSEEKKKALDVLMAQADGDLISRKDTLRKAFYVSTESFDGSVVDAEVIFKMPSVAIPSAEPCEDANANQHNSNALNDVGQYTNALEGDAISRQAVLEQINCWIGSGEYRYTNATYYLTERVKNILSVKPQDCDTCEVGNPCLYCKHEFEPQEGSEE